MPRPSTRSTTNKRKGAQPRATSSKRTRSSSVPRDDRRGEMIIDDALVSRIADAVTQRLVDQNVLSAPPRVVVAPTPETVAPNITAGGNNDVTIVREVSAGTGEPNLDAGLHYVPLAAQPVRQDGPPGKLDNPFVSSGVDIDARVNDKLKSKIWNNEYVDFGSLLVNPVGQTKFQISVQNKDSSPSLCVEPLDKPRNITSIDTWLTAFHVFVGVYARKYPTETPGAFSI